MEANDLFEIEKQLVILNEQIAKLIEIQKEQTRQLTIIKKIMPYR